MRGCTRTKVFSFQMIHVCSEYNKVNNAQLLNGSAMKCVNMPINGGNYSAVVCILLLVTTAQYFLISREFHNVTQWNNYIAGLFLSAKRARVALLSPELLVIKWSYENKGSGDEN